MKTSTILLAGLTATASAVAITPEKAAGNLEKRDCSITCPWNLVSCRWSPYNYRCDASGHFTYDRRDMECENPEHGCYCSCDFITFPFPGTKMGGVEKKTEGVAEGKAVVDKEDA